MLAPRNIPTATASRRVEESKVDLRGKVEKRQKSKNIVSIKKNEVLNILNIWTGKMILWHACGQELNLLSEKRNFKKPQNLCLKRWYLYSILRNFLSTRVLGASTGQYQRKGGKSRGGVRKGGKSRGGVRKGGKSRGGVGKGGKSGWGVEELSGTYLKEKTCMSKKTMSYVRRSSRTYVRT